MNGDGDGDNRMTMTVGMVKTNHCVPERLTPGTRRTRSHGPDPSFHSFCNLIFRMLSRGGGGDVSYRWKYSCTWSLSFHP